jgi:hypothetical protein
MLAYWCLYDLLAAVMRKEGHWSDCVIVDVVARLGWVAGICLVDAVSSGADENWVLTDVDSMALMARLLRDKGWTTR